MLTVRQHQLLCYLQQRAAAHFADVEVVFSARDAYVLHLAGDPTGKLQLLTV